jgi:catechol 2,3-dioxygenase-like lactoylglutathione lyase family enzyme
MEGHLVLSGVHLVVADVRATVEFYRRLGVDIPDDAVWEVDGKSHHVSVKMPGGVDLELDSVEMTKGYDPAWAQAPGPRGNIISFGVSTREEVDVRHDELVAAGYPSHLAPCDAFWGARYAVVLDPDGNQVGLMSPMDGPQGPPPGLAT